MHTEVLNEENNYWLGFNCVNCDSTKTNLEVFVRLWKFHSLFLSSFFYTDAEGISGLGKKFWSQVTCSSNRPTVQCCSLGFVMNEFYLFIGVCIRTEFILSTIEGTMCHVLSLFTIVFSLSPLPCADYQSPVCDLSLCVCVWLGVALQLSSSCCNPLHTWIPSTNQDSAVYQRQRFTPLFARSFCSPICYLSYTQLLLHYIIISSLSEFCFWVL